MVSLACAIVFIGVLFILSLWLRPLLLGDSAGGGSRGGWGSGERDDDFDTQEIGVETFVAATQRMEQRIQTIERIMTADNPNWRV